MKIRHTTEHEIRDIYGCHANFAADALVCENGSGVVALGGITNIDGTNWAFFDVTGDIGNKGSAVVRAVRRELKRVGGEIYTLANTEHETSERLLRILGFEPTGTVMNNLDVYRWQIR